MSPGGARDGTISILRNVFHGNEEHQLVVELQADEAFESSQTVALAMRARGFTKVTARRPRTVHYTRRVADNRAERSETAEQTDSKNPRQNGAIENRKSIRSP
jgi:hypothetical protein